MIKNMCTVYVNGEIKYAEHGTVLSDIVGGEKPCGAHGKCGKCRVRVFGSVSAPTDEETALLGTEAIKSGIRLSCTTRVLGDCEIFTLDESTGAIITAEGTMPSFAHDPTFSSYGVAIDIGTTTLAAALYKKDGTRLAEATMLNPQSAWGADVISRIEAAMGGNAHSIAEAIRGAVCALISTLSRKADIDEHQIDGVVITGNTVMLTLFSKGDCEPFSHAPFDVKRLFGEEATASDCGINCLLPHTRVYFPPCISAFVGADITCAIVASELTKSTTALLADIGTNGEIALWHGGKLTVCSTAAGPAFEGVGISMGMRAAVGAIDKVNIVSGSLYARVIGGTEPTGICAGGLIDAVACLLDLEMLDEDGYLESDPTPILSPVSLTQKDIRMLQLAKSAISAGLSTLVSTTKICASEVSALYVAGGFGTYLDKQSAIKTGLIPRALAAGMKPIGNAALTGASMLLLSSSLRREAEKLAQGAETLELSTSSVFQTLYISNMSLCPF